MTTKPLCILCALGLLLAAGPAWSDEDGICRSPTTAPAVKDFKPLSDNVKKGLAWVAQHQLPGGAWGQGEESANMGGGAGLKDSPSVGDTCMALMALIRGGSTPEKGEYARQVAAGVKFICEQVEASDADSLVVTKLQGTRIQGKLGQFVDTFLTSLLLTEVQEKTTDKVLLARVTKSLEKVLKKIEKNQRPDGRWGNGGWAGTLEQGIGAKAVNRAAQAGNAVPAPVLSKVQSEAAGRFDAKGGRFAGEGSAGVDLYASSSSLGAQQDSANTNARVKEELKKELASAKPVDPARKMEINAKLKNIADAEVTLEKSREAVVAKLDDKSFIAGFGSNGGEEFLSHMNIGESLVVAGGEPWKKWDESMTRNMNNIQNADGSWSGHHCITGRTFCTSAALLVLMVDRTPVPMSAKIRGGK